VIRVSIAANDQVSNDAAGRVAPFSSQGPAFDGSVKPDLVAPGVAIPTADAGTAADGTPRYATVTGSSAAAAAVAGVAALLAEARPDLDAAGLAGAIAGTATPLTVDGLPESVTLQGAGLVDASAAATTEIVVDAGPTVPGDERSGVWASQRTLRITNVSDHVLTVAFGFVTSSDSRTTPVLTADPGSIKLESGASGKVVLAVSSLEAPEGFAGTIVLTGTAGTMRIPWVVAMAQTKQGRLVSDVVISKTAFAPSLKHPSVVTFRAGRILSGENGLGIEPVALLELELRTAQGKRLGVLARLRDVLPGRYSVGLTGRDSDGRILPPGRYVLKVRALGVTAREGARGGSSAASVSFTIRRPASR
jgi:hypothetical protein